MSTVAKFDNSTAGFNQLARKHFVPTAEVVFAMEATGIYYKSLAYYLCKLNQQIWVILPNKVKHYTKSLI